MTTIITVHGTNANDDASSGEQWWQQGSDFQRKLNSYIDPIDSELSFLPFHWNGENSESARRAAGARLSRLLEDHEMGKEPIGFIGHSHGGSVIYHGLKHCAGGLPFSIQKKLAKQTRVWLTVGTPFLSFSGIRLMSVIATIYQLLGLVLLTLLLALLFVSLIPTLREYATEIAVTLGVVGKAKILKQISWGIIALVFLGPLTIVSGPVLILYFRLVELTQKIQSSNRVPAWIGLWHAQDEAITALSIARHKHLKIMPQTLGQGFIAISVSFLISAGIYSYIWGLAPTAPPELSLTTLSTNDVTYLFQSWMKGPINLIFLFPAVWAGIYLLCKPLAYFLAIPVAAGLNSIASNGIVSNIMGSDMMHSSVSGVDNAPAKFVSWPALPPELAEKIDEYAGTHSGDFIKKGRAALGLLHLNETDAELSRAITDTLTWKELIHTAYFQVDPFIKLIAVALCDNGLAKPSLILKNDPEYNRVCGWYAEMKPAGAKI